MASSLRPPLLATRIPGLAVAALLLAGASAAQVTTQPPSAGTFDQTKEDPAGDVFEGRAEGGPGGASGSWRRVGGHEDVDILRSASRDQGSDVLLSLEVAGAIRDEASAAASPGNFSGAGFGYNFALDVRGDGEPEHQVSYGAGSANLYDRERDRTTSVRAQADGATLRVIVPKPSLGSVEKFLFTASAVETSTQVSNQGFSTLSFVDVVGPFPGYEAVHQASVGPSGVGAPTSGFVAPGAGPALAALGLAGAALLAARRRLA